ncbi:uncharacterized protein LOC133519336 [Cydia pomonella]|uniref:uncharacterized protein LOC133519336 n=1 Tax=Cydia pomonella TaxID=82600 RepID=UPI002ADD59AD|nr:uncharacterized protein LOC133519336 [Cydia pomonella]
MLRKNPNKKTLDFSRTEDVDRALNMLLSSSESEESETSNHNAYDQWTEDTWMITKLDEMQNNDMEVDNLFGDQFNILAEEEAIQERATNSLPALLVSNISWTL